MELPYAGDTSDPRQHCQHGTFIGSWWGPDYLCGWCEEGIGVDEMRRIQAEAERLRGDRAERQYQDMVLYLSTVDISPQGRAAVLNFLVHHYAEACLRGQS